MKEEKVYDRYKTLYPSTSNRIELIAYDPIPLTFDTFMNNANSNSTDIQRGLENIAQLTGEAGFTSAIISTSLNSANKLMSYCKANGFGIIIGTEDLYDSIVQVMQTVKDYNTKSKVEGWMVKKFPEYWEWGDFYAMNGKEWNQVTIGYNTCRSFGRYKNTVRRTFVILEVIEDADISTRTKDEITKPTPDLPSVPSDYLWFNNVTGTVSTYDGYLDALEKVLCPDIWCYAFNPYKYKVENEQVGKVEIDYDGFYKWLEKFAARSAKTDNPFWTTISCCAYERYKQGKLIEAFPNPDEGMLRFEILHSLAFGVQGFIFNRAGIGRRLGENTDGLLQPSNSAVDGILDGIYYKNAIIECTQITSKDRDISVYKGKDYDIFKQINKLVGDFGRYLSGCRYVDSVQVGEYIDDETGQLRNFIGKQFTGSFYCVRGISEYSRLGLLMTYLVSEKRHCVVIANHDIYNSQKFMLQYDTSATLIENKESSIVSAPVNREVRNLEKAPTGVSVKVSVTLPAGGIALLTWENTNK